MTSDIFRGSLENIGGLSAHATRLSDVETLAEATDLNFKAIGTIAIGANARAVGTSSVRWVNIPASTAAIPFRSVMPRPV